MRKEMLDKLKCKDDCLLEDGWSNVNQASTIFMKGDTASSEYSFDI